MKSKGLKSIVALSAVSLGVLFAGANSANASTKVTVQSGDTLSKIAKTYNVSIQSLQEANKIQDINRIYAGETFIIGNDGDVQVAASSAQTAPTTVKAPVAAPVQQAQPAAQPQQAAKPAATTPAAQPAEQSKPAQAAAPVQQAQPAAQPQQAAKPATTTPAAQPVQAAKPAATQQAAPVQKQQTTQAAAQPAPAKTTTNNSAATNNDGSLDSIAAVESGNNYNARNGQYIGKYQLSSSYLNGDYSPANQEAVARQYAISRYGSVANAVAYRNAHNYW